jgi:hypothetical protein
MEHPEPLSTVEYATPQMRPGLPRLAIAALKFAIVLAASTVACTVFWRSCVTDALYRCSDSVWLDYLQGPGGWVHGTVAGQPGQFGDTIRQGWSLGGLEALWFSLVIVSIAVSVVLSRIRWVRQSGSA